MLNLREIHKPTTLTDALKLLQQPGTVALAGGTALHADARRSFAAAQDVQAVVDLSALGLTFIREAHGTISIGATTSLADLAESPILNALANGVIARAAHRSVSSVLRHQATIAGTLIAEPDGILAVALLALDARVTIKHQETRTFTLADFLAMRAELLPRSLVTEISVAFANPRAALHDVARTPSDKPIVCVCVAAQIENGTAHRVRIALGGVGDTALRASAAEQVLEGQTLNDAAIVQAGNVAAQGLSPHGEPSTALRTSFRGSAEYRKEMASVLTRRAVKELAG